MSDFKNLLKSFEGDLLEDDLTRRAYATDASVYRELPVAVALPRSTKDLQELVRFSIETNCPLIPRAAGTSLAGQVVGSGLVVDVSRYLNQILEINPEQRYAWVQPGVVLEELNQKLSPHGLVFGPETSTANRCMIGGMLGNNACGLHSLIYGSTREHTLAVEAVLSDGSLVRFDNLSGEEYERKRALTGLEGQIYRTIGDILIDPNNQDEIRVQFPHPAIPRRNSGYALDLLLNCQPFSHDGAPLNLSRILAGSEGTLALFAAIKLQLSDPLPPHNALICAHFSSIPESLKANLVALQHQPSAVELMDSVILSCTSGNKEQERNRFFIEGSPAALLIIECNAYSAEELERKTNGLIKALKEQQLGYAYPVVRGEDIRRVWNLRKAGLGLLSNLPGDARPLTLIEDTAVSVNDLPDYIEEIEALFTKHQMQCVYHAHVGTGELHLRPVLNLKNPVDVVRFRQIATETVDLVKRYRGSFSGEHGDGRLRSEFIPLVLGERVYQMLSDVKKVFDPHNLFNPGIIVSPVLMDKSFRVTPGVDTPEIETYFNWDESLGVVRATERCNGSGDCRKSHLIGGTMCPSYQATRDERNTTRARANILREYLYEPPGKNRFDHPEIYEILDLCLSCKACKSECPSSVDMAKLKAEFLQHWYDANGAPFRSWFVAEVPRFYHLASKVPALLNGLMSLNIFRRILFSLLGFARERSLPSFSKQPLGGWRSKRLLSVNPGHTTAKGPVFLFLDEFTRYQDAEIGIKALKLLSSLGYEVIIPRHGPSARTYLSKGFLRKASRIASENVELLFPLISDERPLIGIEPSALLSFRDEYPDLLNAEIRHKARALASHSLMIDEFLTREMQKGIIRQEQFTDEPRKILFHGHCQQKAVSTTASTLAILNFPAHFDCTEIPSGCCGMAGSFGMEKEHYKLSMEIGELVLFPAVRNASPEVTICAAGTSCRQQIQDGTGRKALHPVEILFNALK